MVLQGGKITRPFNGKKFLWPCQHIWKKTSGVWGRVRYYHRGNCQSPSPNVHIEVKGFETVRLTTNSFDFYTQMYLLPLRRRYSLWVSYMIHDYFVKNHLTWYMVDRSPLSLNWNNGQTDRDILQMISVRQPTFLVESGYQIVSLKLLQERRYYLTDLLFFKSTWQRVLRQMILLSSSIRYWQRWPYLA